jgi:hypothetical protein
MLNVICCNVGNYCGRGQEYVEKLKIGVARNLSLDYAFHVITEAPGEGWWSKISLFEPGRFKGRCLFFDLDTMIVGSIDELAGYDGDFAGINDLYFPKLFASGVMAWEAGKADQIYTRWVAAGMPQFDKRGDGGWIGDVMPYADRLQDKFSDQIVSFKAHCLNGIPRGARVVCFHGLPRPHVLRDVISNW